MHLVICDLKIKNASIICTAVEDGYCSILKDVHVWRLTTEAASLV